jgi:GNAT superfamily N-acetyltransferase
MKRSDWSFRALNKEERAALYQEHMCRDFPDNELKPLEMLEDLQAKGISRIWGCFYQGELSGYYVLVQEPGQPMILLDYLAVVPERRGCGSGSMILRHLREELKEGEYLFIESERPEAAETPEEQEIRQRRVSFYQRNGGQKTPLKVVLFGVDYVIFTLGRKEAATGQELERAYRSLYEQMLPKERCDSKVKTSILT